MLKTYAKRFSKSAIWTVHTKIELKIRYIFFSLYVYKGFGAFWVYSRPFSPKKQSNHWSAFIHALQVSHSPRAYTNSIGRPRSLPHSASVCLLECVCVRESIQRDIETGLAVRKLLAASSALANVGHYATYSNAETDSRLKKERKRGDRNAAAEHNARRMVRAHRRHRAIRCSEQVLLYSDFHESVRAISAAATVEGPRQLYTRGDARLRYQKSWWRWAKERRGGRNLLSRRANGRRIPDLKLAFPHATAAEWWRAASDHKLIYRVLESWQLVLLRSRDAAPIV